MPTTASATTEDLDLLRGTLDLLILKTLSWGPMHGLGVLRWIERATEDRLQIEEGALYPALHRMEARGLIAAQQKANAEAGLKKQQKKNRQLQAENARLRQELRRP